MITIGQFSKICSVSIKTLRYYDKVDLLKPAKVDEWTSYRYYDESQFKDMLTINRLKRYGFSLIEIKSFLSSQDPTMLCAKLKDQAEIIKTEIGHKEMILRELDNTIKDFERTGDFMNYQSKYEIKVKEEKNIPILSSRQNMSIEDFGKYCGRLFEKIAKEGIQTTGVCLAIYHDKEFDENNSDIEIGIGVKNEKDATRVLEGGLFAETTHFGAYSNLSEGYAAVIHWINENGYEITAPPYEIYRKSHIDNIPVEEWETDIFFPIKKK